MTVECAGGVEKATGNVQPGAVEFADRKRSPFPRSWGSPPSGADEPVMRSWITYNVRRVNRVKGAHQARLRYLETLLLRWPDW